jgi:hypothetical protein
MWTKSASDQWRASTRFDLGPKSMGMDSAGSSARREHARRRAARERALRDRHPRLGGLLVALSTPPAHERAWGRGAEGEERAAARLQRLLLGTGVLLLHDRRLPGSRANVDHLAIGPGGVTVIDTKRLSGKVEVRGRGPRAQLRVGGRDRTNLLEGIERQVAAVTAVVGAVDVRAALCFVESEGLPLLRRLEPRGVLVDGTRSVAKLAARPGGLSPAAIDTLVSALATALPPA